MDLAHAIMAGGLAARATERRRSATENEIREAEQRVAARSAARATASTRAEYPARGRHAAAPPARA